MGRFPQNPRLNVKRLILLSSLLFITLYGAVLYTATGTPSTLVVRTDANNYLLVTAVSQTNPITQGVFSSRTLRTDSTGSLQVVLTGTVTPTYPQAIPASTCAAPSLGLAGNTDNGIAFTATPSILNCIEGVAVTTLTGSSFTSTVPHILPAGSIASASLNFGDIDSGFYSPNGKRVTYMIDGTRVFVSEETGLQVDSLFFDISTADIALSKAAAKLLNLNSSLQITRGTITTDLPVRTDTVTWNAGGVTFTGWKLNVTDTASAAGSLLMDLQVGGVSQFKVSKAGDATVPGIYIGSAGEFNSYFGFGNARTTLRDASTNGMLNITNYANTFGLQLISGATAAPTFNNGTIDAGSRNSAGKVVLTGGNTGGTVTFATPNFTNAPFCTVTGTAATDVPQITSTSTSTLVVAGITSNGTFYYLCIGRI